MVNQKPTPTPTGPAWQQRLQRVGDKAVRVLFGSRIDWSKWGNLLGNNYDLGVQHFRAGNYKDAILRLKLVVWLNPEHAGAWYYLGRSFLSEGKRSDAKKALGKAAKLKPDHAETQYLLAVAMGAAAPEASLPKKMPLSLSLEHFNAIAADFTREQTETYQYKAPTLVNDAVRAALAPGKADHHVLELGVGTGLVGSRLRDVASQMTGVDMSGNMLAQASKLASGDGRKTYDALAKKEAHEFLSAAESHAYDIALAVGLISYIGDSSALFREVGRVLKPGGVFALTADILKGEGYRFDPATARFAFSKTYLQGLAKDNGLTELRLEEAEIYPEYKMWLCVFRK